MEKLFIDKAANENNPKWNNIISRKNELYSRNNEIRSDFERDYTRIIHSTAYRRLKHKTQVFYAPVNDHICTRIEHVTYVESISYTIASALGLNTGLTKAIATAHDLGHSPFGHKGEKILSNISMRDLGYSFWHEKNGLEMVDSIEVLEDGKKNLQNLNLTYGVRDGIISHCGEIDENNLKPREEFIDLSTYTYPNQYNPYTWEGCVVKIADKISYLGRDIEDSVTLGILDEHLDELYSVLELPADKTVNNTTIINDLIYDLVKNSSPEKGLCFSEKYFNILNKIKEFNYRNIYSIELLKPSDRYFNVVLNEIYNMFKNLYVGDKTFENLEKSNKFYPHAINRFKNWLECYIDFPGRANSNYKNDILFDISNEKGYCKAILYYISGMTDNYAIDIYNEIIGF